MLLKMLNVAWRQPYIFISAVALTTLPAQAEVFKCQTRSGKTIYQSEPCAPSAKKQQVLEVEKMTPEQREEANAKLRDWREQQAVEEAAKAEAEKEQRLEWERQESLNLQRRSVLAQEQQARAAQRQTPVRPYIAPYAPYFPYWPGGGYFYPYPQQHPRYPPPLPSWQPDPRMPPSQQWGNPPENRSWLQPWISPPSGPAPREKEPDVKTIITPLPK